MGCGSSVNSSQDRLAKLEKTSPPAPKVQTAGDSDAGAAPKPKSQPKQQPKGAAQNEDAAVHPELKGLPHGLRQMLKDIPERQFSNVAKLLRVWLTGGQITHNGSVWDFPNEEGNRLSKLMEDIRTNETVIDFTPDGKPRRVVPLVAIFTARGLRVGGTLETVEFLCECTHYKLPDKQGPLVVWSPCRNKLEMFVAEKIGSLAPDAEELNANMARAYREELSSVGPQVTGPWHRMCASSVRSLDEAVRQNARLVWQSVDEKYSSTYPAFGEHQRKVRYVYFVEFDVLPIEHQNADSGEALIVASWPKAKPLYAQDRQETAGGNIEDAKLKRVIEWQWLTMSEMPPGMREKAGENFSLEKVLETVREEVRTRGSLREVRIPELLPGTAS